MSHHVDTIQSYVRAEAYYARRHWERMCKELSDALDELERLEAAGADQRELLLARKRVGNLRQELATARDEALQARQAELAATRK